MEKHKCDYCGEMCEVPVYIYHYVFKDRPPKKCCPKCANEQKKAGILK